MDTRIFLDVTVILLLAASIISMVIINRRLNQLRENRDDLPRLLVAFNDATTRAEAGIPKLRIAVEEANGLLQERVEKAQLLRDDLAFMIERADVIANNLDEAVRQARGEIKHVSVPNRGHQSRNQAVTGGTDKNNFVSERSEAERELLQALQSVR